VVTAIVQGFSVPLKGEHRTLYEKCLLPLHKANQAVHQQLVSAVLAYLEKDAAGAGACVQALLRYWPLTNPAKEILFINELEEVTPPWLLASLGARRGRSRRAARGWQVRQAARARCRRAR